MSKGMVCIDDASLDILHNGIVVYSVPMTWRAGGSMRTVSVTFEAEIRLNLIFY
jgi:hypothetical protein